MNHLSRRNLSAFNKSVLVLRLKGLIAEQAKEHQRKAGHKAGEVLPQISAEAPIDTREELAKIAGVSHDTIHKVEVILEKASKEIKQKIETDKISIDKGYKEVKEAEQDKEKDGKVKQGGAPAKIRENEISILTKKVNITINNGKSQFVIFGLPEKELLTIPSKLDETTFITLGSNTLKHMIKKTIFSVSSKVAIDFPPRREIRFTLKDGLVEMAAYNDCYSAYVTNEASISMKEPMSVIIPTPVLNEIIRTFPEEKKNVKIAINKNYIFFNLKNVSLISRLVKNTSFKEDHVIPSKFETHIRANTKNLLKSVNRVSFLGRDQLNSAKLKVEKNLLIIENKTSKGDAEDSLEVVTEGSEIEVIISVGGMLDIISAIDTEETAIKLNPSGPVLINPYYKNAKEGNYFYVLMSKASVN